MIIEKTKRYQYSSFTYMEEEELEGTELFKESENCFLVYKQYAKKNHLYWAAADSQAFTEALKEFITFSGDKKVYTEFVPQEFLPHVQKLGFIITSEFQDFWNVKLSERHDCLPHEDSEIKELTLSQCEQASRLTKACAGQSRGFDGESEEFFSNWLKENDSTVLCLKENIYGVCMISLYGPENNRVLWIRLLAVHPQYQRKGFARRLLNASLRWGVKKGAVKSFLHADVHNDKAISLYEKSGYMRDEGRGQINMEREGSDS